MLIMSNRTQVFAQPMTNPSTRFMEWKSKHKLFSFWSKADEKELTQTLPFKFLLLDELHTIGGWNDSSESRIFANEVKFIGKQEITVKASKGGVLAKGLYSVIKDQAKNAGGHYLKSIYVMLEDNSLVNIRLKGSAVKEWGDFTQANRAALTGQWIEVNGAKDSKKGSVTFSTPEFTLGKALTANEEKDADVCFDGLESYLKAYLVQQDTSVDKEDDIAAELEEDLDF
jgi:hypothetical protein